MFWCKFGGVPGGGGVSMEDSDGVEVLDVGVDGSDIVLRVEGNIRGVVVLLSQWPRSCSTAEGRAGLMMGK